MKKILFCIGLSMFLLLQGCSAMMALSGSQNPDFKVITKGNSKSYWYVWTCSYNEE